MVCRGAVRQLIPRTIKAILLALKRVASGVEKITISLQHPDHADKVVEVVPVAGERIDVEIHGCGVKITGRVTTLSQGIGVTMDEFTITNAHQGDASVDGNPDTGPDAANHDADGQ